MGLRTSARNAGLLCALATLGCSPAADARTTPVDQAGTPVFEPDHVVLSTPENLSWGWFPIEKPPVLTVQSGETVEIHTLTGAGSDQDEHPVDELAGSAFRNPRCLRT